ncbi:MAG: cysteine--tRNA ligase [Methylococcales bacterium]|nr:cysteine--tRNA ligase [Methylococcales bacterium]MBT7410311.1 cysteine--tRNA ligase [Methylococcales bacterium]
MLTIYNTLTKEKAEFKPIQPGKVKIYVCGMTVYDHCHIGHARVLVVFDVIVRYLRHIGYDVTYVRNITDVDDKIIKRANENNEDIKQLTTRFIESMHQDAKELGVKSPDIEPKATDSMASIISMVKTLVDKGMAYVGENNDVYYSVGKFDNYAQLSGKNIEDLVSGTRVDVNEVKKDPLDFVLWKAAKSNEPSWESPWGQGRPGWHIECSAMSTDCLGNHFDIHGGGMDLQFPHHDNEIAQSEAATGEHFVNYWMHNGFVRINEEKMSKSLGNFFTVKEVLKQYRGEEIRYFILASHYRSPLNYSDQQLDAAKASLSRLYTAIRGVDFKVSGAIDPNNAYAKRFYDAMNDDINTSEAVSVLFDLSHEINQCRANEKLGVEELVGLLVQLGSVIGLLQQDAEQFFKATAGQSDDAITDQAIDELIQQRLTARQQKNWAEADNIRDQLSEQGVILEDGAGGTTWKRE